MNIVIPEVTFNYGTTLSVTGLGTYGGQCRRELGNQRD